MFDIVNRLAGPGPKAMLYVYFASQYSERSILCIVNGLDGPAISPLCYKALHIVNAALHRANAADRPDPDHIPSSGAISPFGGNFATFPIFTSNIILV